MQAACWLREPLKSDSKPVQQFFQHYSLARQKMPAGTPELSSKAP